MSDYVELYYKRNRGWPWPDESWGLTPMFGENGWCRSCGVPLRTQCGSLVLQRKGFTTVMGAWVPNWQFDAICLEGDLADEVAGRFNVELLDVEWRGNPPGSARQLIVPRVGDRWFDADELREAAVAKHGTAGATCPDCGTWRWMPLAFGMLPPLRITPGLGRADIAGSPEWFGAGRQAFRQILVRRELADLIAAASPKDFRVQPVT